MEDKKTESEKGLEDPSQDSQDDEVLGIYRLDFALLSPLKVSLFPAKSFPSVATECGNRDSILRLEMDEIEFGESAMFPPSSDCSPPERRVMMQQKEMTSCLTPTEKIVLEQNHDTGSSSVRKTPAPTPLVVRRVKQGSLLRRRSSSLPDIDRISFPQIMGPGVDVDSVKSELDILPPSNEIMEGSELNKSQVGAKNNGKTLDSLFKSNTICSKTYSSSSASLCFTRRENDVNGGRYLHGKPLTGVQSLPRINRSPTSNDTIISSSSPLNIPSSRYNNKSPIKLAMSAMECAGGGGNAGSFGDLMNLLQFGSSRNSPTNSEILAAAVPLETVTKSSSTAYRGVQDELVFPIHHSSISSHSSSDQISFNSSQTLPSSSWMVR